MNDIAEATPWLDTLEEGEAAISVVTYAEVLVGTKPSEEDAIHLLLQSFKCLPIKQETARLAAELRQKYKWKLPDAFQAALAMENRLHLITRNTKDFPPKTHAFVKLPYQL